MFEIQNYASFVGAILLFQLIPGPGTLAILTATARSGLGAGCGAVMGTLVGDFVYMVAAVVGLAAVMNANPVLFRALQWFGVAYLCWIGVQLLRARLAGAGTAPDSRKSAWVYFRQAFVVSLTNPKVVLFFVAFFPLFLRVDASPITLGAMMAHVTVISFSVSDGPGADRQRGGAHAVVAAGRPHGSHPLRRSGAHWFRGQIGTEQSIAKTRRSAAGDGGTRNVTWARSSTGTCFAAAGSPRREAHAP